MNSLTAFRSLAGLRFAFLTGELTGLRVPDFSIAILGKEIARKTKYEEQTFKMTNMNMTYLSLAEH